MVERYKTAYTESRRVRMLVSLGLFVWGALLYALAGGFPPWAWRFLAHVLSQLPQLWANQGSAIIVPMVGLVLLSLSLFILWALLLFAVYKVVLYWWHHLHEHEHFAMDLRDAELMAEEAVTRKGPARAREEYERWQPAPPTQLKQPAARTQPVQARPQVYTVARGSRVVGSSGLIRVPSAAFSDETPFPGEAPTQAKEPRTMPVTVPMQPSARVALESRTMPMSAPTQAMPRVPLEPRTQFPQSMQVTQPGERQAVGRRTAPLTAPPSAPQSPLASTSMREQLRIVPRVIEEPGLPGVYDTMPIIPGTQDVAAHDTLPFKTREAFDKGTDKDVYVEEVEEDLDIDLEEVEEDLVADLAEADMGIEKLETRPDRETFPSVEPLRLLVGIGLDAGIARKDVPNEDNLFAIQGMRPTNAGPEPVGLFIIADGMGGHAHGQEASKLAVHAVSDAIVPTLMRQMDNDEVFSDLLKDGVHRANLAIYRRNREQEHMMGTTLTAVLMVARTAYIVNVGDSRTYLYRPTQGMRQITRDHSVVGRLVEDGVIKREDMYTHPRRNQIYRCLGEHATVEVDTFVEPLQADDVLVLCSDGLWEMVHDDEMESIVASSASYPSQLSKLLIQAALMRGGADNISVIVARMAQTETE